MSNFQMDCSVCGDTFDSASGLLKHYADYVRNDLLNGSAETQSPSAHIKAQVSSYEDVDSGFEDVNPIALCRVTMNTNMQNMKPFKCNLCKSSFTKRTALSNHKIKKHNRALPQLKPIKFFKRK
ncbi:PREDICTED: zinc finger protein sens-like [Nicrophorus vespilloides]|uniref:Zinc finger protein sens-like n=1 Tax=Nicrophorus vespilloides TaxID=110193 RepID=A0ABM1M7D1_NICVS|nr:PREDICTED: zinc finger protein sens-like [Nicrophorus vespilloides]